MTRKKSLSCIVIILCLISVCNNVNCQQMTYVYTGTGSYPSTNPDIPSGATNISFSLTMGSCDYDLHVKEGATVSTSSYDCRPYSASGTTENCGPYAGPYNGSNLAFLINPYSGASCTWTLTITYTPPDGPTVQVTYNANGGTTTCTSPATHFSGYDYTICSAMPTLQGFDFAGWSDGENIYYPGGVIEDLDSDITLTAQWEKATCGKVIYYDSFEGYTNCIQDNCVSAEDLVSLGMDDKTDYMDAETYTICNYEAGYRWTPRPDPCDCRKHGDCSSSVSGVYALAKATFQHTDWTAGLPDHTFPGDVDHGFMMQMDATNTVFYKTTISGVAPGSYTLSAWLLLFSSVNSGSFTFTVKQNGTTLATSSQARPSVQNTWEERHMDFYVPTAGSIYLELSVSDADFSIDDIKISSHNAMAISIVPSNDCSSESGEIYVSVNGGVAPYTYEWNDGTSVTQSSNITHLSNLEAGNYELTITDYNGCEAYSSAVVVTDGMAPTVTINSITASANPVCSGSTTVLTANVTSNATDLSYVWSNHTTLVGSDLDLPSVTARPTENTTYRVTVTARIGCCTATATASIAVTVRSAVTTTITATPGTCSANAYSNSVRVTFTQSQVPSGASLTICDGTECYTVNSPQTPVTHTFSNLTADGVQHTVSASFSGVECSNSIVYLAPNPCCTALSVTELDLTPGDRNMELSWPKVANSSSYNIYYGIVEPTGSNNTEVVRIVNANVTCNTTTCTYTVPDLTNGRDYYFSVMPVGNGTAYCLENQLTTEQDSPECE